MHPARERTIPAKRDSCLIRWNAGSAARRRFLIRSDPDTGRSIVVLGALLFVAACGSLRGGTRDDRSADDGVSRDDGAIILTGRALTDGSNNILAALRGKVPNLRVIRNVRNECPQISIRNRVNFQGYRVNPHVYVDGTRATDTCILESLRSSDVQRIEVYPQGFTNRPGYGSHAEGLILVFMRSS